jgi:DNA polymerase elongation subunit (family B)
MYEIENRPKIIRNSAKCRKCEDEIESKYRWDFKWCKCGAIAVDGGKDYLKRVGELENIIETSLPTDDPVKKEKILLWDVETSESIVKTFSLYNRYISHKKILRDWFIICGSWKFLDENRVDSVSLLSDSQRFAKDFTDDYEVVKQLREAVLQADIIVHHNGDKFDIKKLNTRLIYHRLPPLPVKLTTVDTLKEARHSFAFSSNRLDYLGKYLGVGQKVKTDDELWGRILDGEVSAIEEMLEYNKGDVRLLEDVYKIMRPYIRHPNTAAIAANDSDLCCVDCQSTNLEYRGYNTNKVGTRRRFQCLNCGKWGHDPKYLIKTQLRAA